MSEEIQPTNETNEPEAVISEPINSVVDNSEVKKPRPLLHTLILAISFLLVFLLGLGLGYLMWVKPLETRLAAAEQVIAEGVAQAEAAEQAAAAQQGAAQQQDVRRYEVPLDDDPILGSADAPVTIVEFSDYECPFCQRWHAEVLPQIKAKYGDQVRFVYRDFPLYSIHANAGSAAEAANCAGEQEQYWEYNDLLFNGQQPLGRETYEKYAQDLKLDADAFAACLDSGQQQKEVEADYTYASELGVRSTPTFFINGLAVVGAQPFDVFEQIIDMELSGEIP